MDALDEWAAQLGQSMQAEEQPAEQLSPAEVMPVEEELAVLGAIYGEDVQYDSESGVVAAHIAPEACRLNATLRMLLPAEYPAAPPVLQLEAFASLPLAQQDVLYAQLMLLAARCAAEGRNALYPLVQLVHDTLSDLAGPLPQRAGQRYLDAAAAADADAAAADDDDDVDVGGSNGGAGEWREGDYHDGHSSATAAEEFHSKGFLSHALVGSLAEVLAKLPPEAGAIRVECIVRQNAKERFLERQAKFGAAGISTAVWTTFHGTPVGSVPSIVRTGLRVPYDQDQVRCGSTFGRGIYTSPSAGFSLAYCNGYQDDDSVSLLLVCAVLPGSISDFDHKVTYAAGSCPSADPRSCRQVQQGRHNSVLANHGQELVIFDAAQVLPCFVLHLHHPKLHNHPYLQATQGGALVATQGGALVVSTHHDAHAAARGEALAARSTLKQVMQEAALEAARLRAAFFIGNRQVLAVADIDDDDDDEWDPSTHTGTQAKCMSLNHGSLIAHRQYAGGRNYQQERHEEEWT